MKIVKLVLVLLAFFANTAWAQDADGLKPVRYIEGEWDMQVSFYQEGKWVPSGPSVKASSSTLLSNSFIRMNMPVQFGGGLFQFEITVSYDRFNKAYRLILLDDLNSYSDIYSGQIQGDKLSLTNAETTTAFPDGEGGLIYGKLVLYQTEKGFDLKSYLSNDMKKYDPYMILVFTKGS